MDGLLGLVGGVLFSFLIWFCILLIAWGVGGVLGMADSINGRQVDKRPPPPPQYGAAKHKTGGAIVPQCICNIEEILTRLGFALCWYSLGKPSSPVSTAVYVESIALSSSRKRNPAALVWSMLS